MAGLSAVSNDTLVTHYLNRIESTTVIPIMRKRRANKASQEGKLFEWALIDRLFCKRKRAGWSLADLESMAVNDCLQDVSRVQNALACYRNQIVGQCGFDDFEPEQSELIQGTAPRSNGLIRARKERQDRIGFAQVLFRTDELFRDALQGSCSAWISYVNGDDAYFAVRSEHEYTQMIAVLSRLGATSDQLDIRYSGPPGTALLALAAKEAKVTHVTGTRYSRGPRRIAVTEIGISIRQKAGSRLGEGRDVHRLFAILACCVCAELMEAQAGE